MGHLTLASRWQSRAPQLSLEILVDGLRGGKKEQPMFTDLIHYRSRGIQLMALLRMFFCDDWSYSVKLTDDEGLLILCGRYEINKGNSTVYYFVKPRVEDEYVLEQVIELDDTAQSIAVDQNAMVVFSNRVRKSRVSVMYPFVLKSNTWEKVATSDEYFPENGDNVAMSGNITLVASTENVYQMMTYV